MMNRSNRIMFLCVLLASSIAILFASLWMKSRQSLINEFSKQAEATLWQLADAVRLSYSQENGWPTNLLVTNVSFASAIEQETGGRYSPKPFDHLLLDPWRNPYHMTLTLQPPTSPINANLTIWSFGPNQRNNGGKRDDIVIRIAIPNLEYANENHVEF